MDPEAQARGWKMPRIAGRTCAGMYLQREQRGHCSVLSVHARTRPVPEWDDIRGRRTGRVGWDSQGGGNTQEFAQRERTENTGASSRDSTYLTLEAAKGPERGPFFLCTDRDHVG
jgi:hypothetical protein